MFKKIKDESEMKIFGKAIGTFLKGGDFIELVGDVGSGKTTLTKDIAVGMGVEDNVQSPSFTINRVYRGRDNLTLTHYDFYRLDDAGIMANELRESAADKDMVTIIEWAGVVCDILPIDRLTIKISSPTENDRELSISAGGKNSSELLQKIKL